MSDKPNITLTCTVEFNGHRTTHTATGIFADHHFAPEPTKEEQLNAFIAYVFSLMPGANRDK